jgi:K+-transporting ATPase A subunit
MTYVGQYLAFVLVLTVLVEPLGTYVERVFSRRDTLLDPLARRSSGSSTASVASMPPER